MWSFDARLKNQFFWYFWEELQRLLITHSGSYNAHSLGPQAIGQLVSYANELLSLESNEMLTINESRR